MNKPTYAVAIYVMCNNTSHLFHFIVTEDVGLMPYTISAKFKTFGIDMYKVTTLKVSCIDSVTGVNDNVTELLTTSAIFSEHEEARW